MQNIIRYIILLLLFWQLSSLSSICDQHSGMGPKRTLNFGNKGKGLAALDYIGSNQACADKRRRTFSSITEGSSACHEANAPFNYSEFDGDYLTNRQRLLQSTITDQVSACQATSEQDSSDDEDAHQVISGMRQKRSIKFGKEGKGLAATLDYPGLSQVYPDKRQRSFPSIIEGSLACHEGAPLFNYSELDGGYLTNRQRLFQSTITDQVSACQGTSEEDNSDDEDVHQVVSGSGGTIFGQASYQRTRTGVVVHYNDSGDDAYTCSYCAALFWSNESLKKKNKKSIDIYSLL